MSSSPEEPPDWLPDGWIMETRMDQNGSIYKYYTCPVSDYTFCNKKDVLLYLKMLSDGCQEYETMDFVEHDYRKDVIEESVQIARTMTNLVNWLPRGWVMEIRQQEGDAQPAKRYKCYVNKSTGSTFYSKEEVLQFLQSDNEGSHTTRSRNSRNVDSNTIAEIEYSPDGVPPGWIRENAYRGGKASMSSRKDPYYLDPISGFIFRTQKDVALYTKYGILSKYCFRGRKRGMFDMELVGSLESPKAQEVCANGRSLGDQVPESDLIKKIDEQLARIDAPKAQEVCANGRSLGNQRPKSDLIRKIDEHLARIDTPCSNYGSNNRTMDGICNGKRKRDNVIEQEVEKPFELLGYSKEKEDGTVKKLFEASDDMSTPLKTFYKKVRKYISSHHKVSNDKTPEQSSSALHILSGEKEQSLKAEAVEDKLQNESHETFSNGHDLDTGKMITLTENLPENERLNSSGKETSGMVVSGAELQGVENELLTTKENVVNIEELNTAETKGSVFAKTDKVGSTCSDRGTTISPRQSSQ